MKYYLVGIKGTGMSSLAKLLYDDGHIVVGSDVSDYYFTEDTLLEKGIIILPFDQTNITDEYFYIIGNAFSDTNVEVAKIKESNYEYLYYHDFIGEKINKRIIACSGTHGKTTTSYLVTKFLDKKCSYIIGDGEGGSYPNDLLVLEACEYKEHFLSYYPEVLIISNIELDHTDYYKSKKQLLKAFQRVANQSKKILVNGDDKLARKISHPNKLTYGFSKKNDIIIKILSTTSSGYYIQIKYIDNIYVKVPFLGLHMIYNYVSGYIATKLIGEVPVVSNSTDLPNRRLTKYFYKKAIIIDDYAHHPTEIKALYETLRLMYKNKKLNVVFQPHTYKRTMSFKRRFVKVLRCFDDVYLMDVFTSKRENNNKKLQKKIDKIFRKFKKLENLVIDDIGKEEEVWVFLGAGVAGNIIKEIIK